MQAARSPRQATDDPPSSVSRHVFYAAALITLDAASLFMARYTGLAVQMAGDNAQRTIHGMSPAWTDGCTMRATELLADELRRRGIKV